MARKPHRRSTALTAALNAVRSTSRGGSAAIACRLPHCFAVTPVGTDSLARLFVAHGQGMRERPRLEFVSSAPFTRDLRPANFSRT